MHKSFILYFFDSIQIEIFYTMDEKDNKTILNEAILDLIFARY